MMKPWRGGGILESRRSLGHPVLTVMYIAMGVGTQLNCFYVHLHSSYATHFLINKMIMHVSVLYSYQVAASLLLAMSQHVR